MLESTTESVDWVSLFEVGESGFVILIVSIGCLTGLGFALISAITTMTTSRGRENTTRELAAYVAEGSLSAEQAAALLRAGRPTSELEDVEELAARAACVKRADVKGAQYAG